MGGTELEWEYWECYFVFQLQLPGIYENSETVMCMLHVFETNAHVAR